MLPSPAAGSRIVPICRAASCKKKSRSFSDSTAVLELAAQPQEQWICSFALKRATGALLKSKDAAAVVLPGKGGTQTRGPQTKPVNTANLWDCVGGIPLSPAQAREDRLCGGHLQLHEAGAF